MAPMAPMSPHSRVRVFSDNGDDVADLDAVRENLRDIGPRVRAELDRELPRMREELDRELPDAMDQVRRSMDRMRLELPRIALRTTHKVII